MFAHFALEAVNSAIIFKIVLMRCIAFYMHFLSPVTSISPSWREEKKASVLMVFSFMRRAPELIKNRRASLGVGRRKSTRKSEVVAALVDASQANEWCALSNRRRARSYSLSLRAPLMCRAIKSAPKPRYMTQSKKKIKVYIAPAYVVCICVQMEQLAEIQSREMK